MLNILKINDLALIANAELAFSPGLNVLTGETGAGKSFILKALDLAAGGKASAGMVRPGCDKAVVEAGFTIDGQLLSLRRELSASGRSRCFINGVPTTRETIASLRLLLHVGQHGHLELSKPSAQAAMVDGFMENASLIAERDRLVDEAEKASERTYALRRRAKDLSERRELLELQLGDINKVNPQPGEEDDLEHARSLLREASRLRERQHRLDSLLHADPGIVELLGQCGRELSGFVEDDDSLRPYLEAVEAAEDALSGLETLLRDRSRSSETLPDPDAVESRLFAFAQLKRKLKKSMPEILEMRKELEQNLSFLDECSLDISHAERDEHVAEEKLRRFLPKLNDARQQAANKLCHALCRDLVELGFSDKIRIIPEMERSELPGGSIELRTRLLWAPNPGQTPRPLDKIASGGELSRFLLASISLQEKGEKTTLVFDEVDAGVGGTTLNRVGERLESLATGRQILLVTHWPGLALRAETHFKVTKTIEGDKTFTRCRRLSDKERREEMDRMKGIENSGTMQS